jgi:prepilin-type N-terminal cleavage/methylation domain-containing protein
MKRDNRGFSLVEMIVVMAILSFVGVGVTAFLSTSTKSFSSVSQNVDVQEEAQTSVNQIVTMIQNAEMGITGTDRSSDGNLYIYNGSDENDKMYRYVITKSGDKLYYLKQIMKESDDGSSYEFADIGDDPTSESSGFSLLAENVKSFSAIDVTTSGTSNTVFLLSVDFSKGTSGSGNYSVSQNVVLRNSVVLNPSTFADVYGTPDAPVTKTTYSNIAVNITDETGNTYEFSYTGNSSNTIYLPMKTSGENVNLSYSVKVSYSGPNPDPSYSVSIDHNSSADTRVDTDNNRIIVGKDETNELSLSFQLTRKASVKADINIVIVRVSGVSVVEGSSVSPDFKDECYVGNTVYLDSENGLVASSTGSSYLEKLNLDSVKWNVEIFDKGNNLVSKTEVTGSSYTIPSNDALADGTITFTATNIFDETMSGSRTYPIKAERKAITLTIDKDTINRGETVTFHLSDEDANTYASVTSDTVSCTFVNMDTGETIAEGSGISVTLGSNCSIAISAENDLLDYNTEYHISMTVTDTNRNISSNSDSFTIPKVTVKFSPSNAIKLYENFAYTYRDWNWNYKKRYSTKVTYTVSGIQKDSISSGTVNLNNSNVTSDENSYTKSTGGTFSFYKDVDYWSDAPEFSTTGTVSINGELIYNDTLKISGYEMPEYRLSISLSKPNVDRGDTVTATVIKSVYNSDEKKYDDSEVSSSDVTWSYKLDNGQETKSPTYLRRTDKVISIYDSDGSISYDESHSITVTVTDSKGQSDSTTISIPEVSVTYDPAGPVYLCSETPVDSVYSKTVTYTISGLKNAIIDSFADNGSSNGVTISCDKNQNAFTLSCTGETSFNMQITPNVKVNSSESSYAATPISGSKYTVRGKEGNIIVINGTSYTIPPENTGERGIDCRDGYTWLYWYKVYDDYYYGKVCEVIDQNRSWYFYVYIDGNWVKYN